MSEGTAKRPRAVVDPYLFVSSIILRGGYPYALRRAWYAHVFVRVISHFQRFEIQEVLKRLRIASRYAISEEDLAARLRRLDTKAELVDPAVDPLIPVRDPKDELILGTALAGQVGCLVTGDKHLLVLADDLRLTMLRVVTVADFLASANATWSVPRGMSPVMWVEPVTTCRDVQPLSNVLESRIPHRKTGLSICHAFPLQSARSRQRRWLARGAGGDSLLGPIARRQPLDETRNRYRWDVHRPGLSRRADR